MDAWEDYSSIYPTAEDYFFEYPTELFNESVSEYPILF
jgi:hypothetical protein